jgi:hypothetical protein
VATSNGGSDPARGSGPEKVTTAAQSDPEAPPGALAKEPADSKMPDPGGGGCMKYGWGCLPVVAVVAALPAGLLY